MPIPRYITTRVQQQVFALLTALLAVAAATDLKAQEPAWKGSLILVQEPPGAWEKCGKRGWPLRIAKPEGARIVVAEPGRNPRVLTEGLASACDPCVSIDSTKVLFAGKEHAEDPWNIFEIGADGSGLRKITDRLGTEGLGDCFEPEYLARGAIIPPDYKDKVRWMVFTSTAPGHFVEAGSEKATSLYVQCLEPIPNRGIVTWRTTFNLSSDFSPTVLSDGRVLYSTWQNFLGQNLGGPNLPGLSSAPAATPGAPHMGTIELFTISWSGEDINPFLPSSAAGLVRSMACETPDRSIVFVESDGSEPDQSGRLARVWLRRPFKTYELLSKAAGRVRNPHPLPDGSLLVSYAPEGKDFGLYLFDFEKGGPGALVMDDPLWSDVDGMALSPRREPLGRITMVYEAAKTATLTCLNVYESDQPEVRAIPKGAVKKVRFVEGLPVASGGLGGAGTARARVLGEALVEADGSFLVRIVPQTPFTMQLLGANDDVLAVMRTWIWLQPGDERGCVGCHEDKELTPENRVTLALLKAKASPVLTPIEERPPADLSSFRKPEARQQAEITTGSHK
ncbi:MAG: hypothetical protein AB1486_16675 [Planctomycetota bacterium]